MSAAWQRTAPPVHISVRTIAMGLGVINGASRGGSGAAAGHGIEAATPDGLQGLLGQSEIPTYNRPRKGFTVVGQDDD